MFVPPTSTTTPTCMEPSQQTSIYPAFVYRWRNLTDGRLYIGYHIGGETDGYVSSSRYFNADYRKDPCNFVREILERGATVDMIKLEHKLLTELNASDNPLYYNRWNGGPFAHNRPHTIEARHKMSIAKRIGRPQSAETREKIRVKALGRKFSIEHRARLSDAKKFISLETRQKMRLAKLGKRRGPHKPETIAKMCHPHIA